MASLREEEILEDKKIFVFLNCLIFAVWVIVVWAKASGQLHTVFWKTVWSASGPKSASMGAGLLLTDGAEIMQLLRLNDVAPLRNLCISRLPTKEARQEQVSVNMIPLIKTGTSLFPQGKGCLV